jgi:hypothetical protein
MPPTIKNHKSVLHFACHAEKLDSKNVSIQKYRIISKPFDTDLAALN